MAILPTNFKDDILDTSVNTRRRYRMYENTDGTIELEDVTEYSQVGDEFSAGNINATNMEVNKKFEKTMIVRDLDTIGAMTKEGYVPDALALKEMYNSLAYPSSFENNETDITSIVTSGYTATDNCKVIFCVYGNGETNPMYSIYINNIQQEMMRTADTTVMWIKYIMLRKGDVLKIVPERSVMHYAKVYYL